MILSIVYGRERNPEYSNMHTVSQTAWVVMMDWMPDPVPHILFL
jgi:hypothetical protein